MSDDEYEVHVKVDGVVFRGRRSVNLRGDRVYIDGQLVGVECDNDGNPLANTLTAPIPVTPRMSRLRRVLRWVLSILRGKST